MGVGSAKKTALGSNPVIPRKRKKKRMNRKIRIKISNGNIKRLWRDVTRHFGRVLATFIGEYFYLGISCCVSNQAKKKKKPENVVRCVFISFDAGTKKKKKMKNPFLLPPLVCAALIGLLYGVVVHQGKKCKGLPKKKIFNDRSSFLLLFFLRKKIIRGA